MKATSALLITLLCGGCATQPQKVIHRSELRQLRPITRSEITHLPSRITVEGLFKKWGYPTGIGKERILVYKSDEPEIDFLVFYGQTAESTEVEMIRTYEMPSRKDELVWEWKPHAGVIRRKK